MPPTEIEVGAGEDMASNLATETRTTTQAPVPQYNLTQLDRPFFLVSLVRQILQARREPKITVPAEYYHGEAALPIVEMRAWYRDLPNIIKAGLEKSTDPVDVFNRAVEKKRALVAAGVAVAAAAAGWFLQHDAGLILGLLGGLAAGRIGAVLLFKKQAYPPDMWQDYRMQQASWV